MPRLNIGTYMRGVIIARASNEYTINMRRAQSRATVRRLIDMFSAASDRLRP